jgi:hypothetical protein
MSIRVALIPPAFSVPLDVRRGAWRRLDEVDDFGVRLIGTPSLSSAASWPFR